MDTVLDALYRAAEYEVHWPVEPFVLRVDQHSEALARCHAAHGVRASVFITAWNPRSVAADAAQNAASQQRLLAALVRDGYRWIDGCGRDTARTWSEESLLVLGMEAAVAQRYAHGFRQSAVLIAGADATPRLMWIQD